MSGAHHKTFRLGQRKAATPSAEQLAAINAFTLREFTADEMNVRQFVLCHNCVDRDGECFDEAILRDFGTSLIGKGVFVKHPSGWDGDSGPGEGLVFETSIETMSLESAQELLRGQQLTLPPDRTQVTLLMADAYFPKTADNAALLTKLDAGVACFVSVGFTAQGGRKQVTDASGHEYELRRWHAPGEAHEMSLVWLGAQPGARAVKSAPRSNEANDMELKEQLDAANGSIKTLTADLTAAKAAGALHDAIKAALGTDHAALAEDPAQLAALAIAGKSYRASLVATIVAADRVAGDVGDDAEAVKAAGLEYEAMPLPALKRLAARCTGTGDGIAKVTGSDPNAAKPNAAETKGAFESPLFKS